MQENLQGSVYMLKNVEIFDTIRLYVELLAKPQYILSV